MTSPRLTPDELKQLSALWDEALDREAGDIEAWRARIVASPSVVAALDDMLSHREATGDSFLHHGGAQAAVAHLQAREPANGAGTLVGAYRLLTQIGRGGMGTVWLAERADGLMRRNVAVKLPHAWLSERFLDRFAVEREILAGLAHPNIARLYEAGKTDQGQPYFVLEYVDGESLVEYCRSHDPSLQQRIELFLQVLDAVEFAHERHVVHRDLKPTNIIVSKDGQAHLLDFGIAKLLTEDMEECELTQFGDAALTPNYASPEQIEGRKVDPRSDVYSLGVLFYELITGTLPYSLERSTRAALQQAMSTLTITRPSEAVAARRSDMLVQDHASLKLARRLRGDLDTIAMTAIQRDPQRRFVSAKAFADDLRRYIAGQPIHCRPDSIAYRMGRFVTRYKAAVAATALVVASMAIGTAEALRSAEEARHQARIAKEQRTIAENEARIADDNAKTATAVTNFMETLFGRTSTDVARHKVGAMTVRELIDDGAAQLDDSLKDAPQAKLRLIDLMAGMYDGLDAPEQASAMYRKHIEMARKLVGSDPRPLIDALNEYTIFVMLHPGKTSPLVLVNEAAALLDKLSIREPEDGERRGFVEMGFAQILDHSDPKGAQLHIERAVAAFAVDKKSGSYARALQGLAHFQTNSGHLSGAIATLSEASSTASQDDVSSVYQSMSMKCDRQREIGELAAALDGCRQSFAGMVKNFGYGEGVGLSESNARALAETLVVSGRIQESRQLLATTIKALKVQTSEPSRRQLGAIYVLRAAAEVASGRPAEAAKWLALLDRLKLTDMRSPSQHLLIQPDGVRADLLAQQGRFEQAAVAANAELAFVRRSGPLVRSPYAASLLATLTNIAISRGNLSAASDTFRQMSNADNWPLDEPMHPTSPRDLDLQLLDARLALAAGQTERAAAAAAGLRRIIDKQPQPEDFRLWSLPAEIVLGRVELQAGRSEAAARHFDQAFALAEASGKDSLNAVEARLWSAQAHLKLGDSADGAATVTYAREVIAGQHTTSPAYLQPLAALEHALLRRQMAPVPLRHQESLFLKAATQSNANTG